jgi:hypothetical protein
LLADIELYASTILHERMIFVPALARQFKIAHIGRPTVVTN